jgi:polysaccharide biosynthesis transport protein
MARSVTVRGGWHLKDAASPEIGPHVLPTMADTGEIDLRRFLRTLYRGKWILLLTIAAVMGVTKYWLSHATPLYSADVLLVLEARPSNIVRVEEAVQDVSTDVAKVNTEVAVLESRGLAARVIRVLGLDKDPEFFRELGLDKQQFASAVPPGTDPGPGDANEGTSTSEPLAKVDPNRLLAAVWQNMRSLLTAAWAGDETSYDPGPDDASEARSSSEPLAKVDPNRLLAAVWQNMRSLLTAAWAGDETSYAQSEEGTVGDTPADSFVMPEASEDERSTALLNGFLERLLVEPEDKSRLIRIGFTSADPRRAALIANKLVKEYMDAQLETKSEGARHAAEWLQVRLAELGETVKSLEGSVRRQRAESGTNGVDIVSQRQAQLNTQLVSAQAASAKASARYSQVRNVLENGGDLDALPAIIASPSIQALRAKHTEAVRKLSELGTTYGEKHPQIISISSEIAGIEQELNRETRTVLAGLRNEVESAQIQEGALRNDLEAVNQEMVKLKASEATIAQTAQRLQANQDLYQNLLKRYTEAVALRENQQPDARVISPAQIALEPSHPNVPRIMVLSFVGSVSLAVFLLVVAERLRQKLGTVEDVERHLGLQVIGTVPDLPRLRRLGSGPRGYIEREPLSEFGGSFQRLRALLTLSNHRVMPRTVLVTSCAAGEGKTTVSVCLGIASISSGQKVLLVDCDFARPQVHRMLDVDNEKGLTDILMGTATLQEAITQAPGSRLSILTVGRSPEGAIDLLNSMRMEELLAELQATFDIIILDAAPVQVSNALILGGLAEKTIFVTRCEWTTHRQALYAVKQLQLYGADIAGVVFNRAGAEAKYAA